MTKPNEQAYPHQVTELREGALQAGRIPVTVNYLGLTKREWYAGLAMAAILWRDDKLPLDVAADLACRATEVLIAELAKENK